MRGILWFIIACFCTGLWTYNRFEPGTGKPSFDRVISGIFIIWLLPVLLAALIGLAFGSETERWLGFWGTITGAIGGGAIWAGVHWFRQARLDKEERARAELAAAEKTPPDLARIEMDVARLGAVAQEFSRQEEVNTQQAKKTRIFISYRRLEDGAHAGRIADRLGQEFDFHDIFIDFWYCGAGARLRRVDKSRTRQLRCAARRYQP